MGYVVECFNNMLNIQNSDHMAKDTQTNLANKWGCTSQYFTNEIEGYKRTMSRNDLIHIAHFESSSFSSLLEYIREIRRYKTYKLDCIYSDDIPCNVLYASSRYLKHLDKGSAATIKNNMKLSNRYMNDIKNALTG